MLVVVAYKAQKKLWQADMHAKQAGANKRRHIRPFGNQTNQLPEEEQSPRFGKTEFVREAGWGMQSRRRPLDQKAT